MKNKTARLEFLLILLLVLGALAAFFLLNPKQSAEALTALVTVDGREVLRVDLSEEREPYVIDLAEFSVPGKLEVKDHQIRFIEVTCPDHICEKTGFLHAEYQTAVCMPNRTAVCVYRTEELS